MENNDPWELNVTSRKSFETFLSLLLSDLKKNSQNWKNNRLDLFLEAMSRYAADLDGYYKNINSECDADTPTWKVFADIIRGAVMYE